MRGPTIVALGLLAVGTVLRLWLLGEAPFSADNMDFYRLAARNQAVGELWKNPPWLNQIPLNETFVLLLMKLGLPATPSMVRLPFALMGIFTLLIVWQFARPRVGPAGGLVVLFLAALNPFQIYFARTAYHYSGAIMWSAAMFWLFWLIKEQLEERKTPVTALWVGWFLVALIACHMHMSVWVVAGLQGVLLFAYGWRCLRDQPAVRRRVMFSLAGGAVLSVLVMSRWIWRATERLRDASGGGKALIGDEALGEFIRLLPAFVAGESLWGVLVLAGLLGLLGVALIIPNVHRAFLRSLAGIVLLHIVVAMLYIWLIGGGLAKITYFSSIWGAIIVLFGMGSYSGFQALVPVHRPLAYGLVVLVWGGYALLAGPAAWAVAHLEGKPTPYFKINEWVQANLPEQTPILVDRWFEPWNELALHNPDDIPYTFTVPDEPLENYVQFNWRDTAEDFFMRYPQAALLEVNRDKYAEQVGRWTFPDTHFARTAEIRNEAGLFLRKRGFIPTSDFGAANTNRVITRIYYNTVEDLIEQARSHEDAVLRLYGPGWGYAKPAWQQGHFEDYRTIHQAGELIIHNLRSMPIDTELRIQGIAAPSALRVRIVGGGVLPFPAQQLVEHRQALRLPPGENRITFRVINAEQTNAQLFVRTIHVDAVAAP